MADEARAPGTVRATRDEAAGERLEEERDMMSEDVSEEQGTVEGRVGVLLAPAALEERIVKALAAAGVKGLGFGDLGDAISHQLEEAVGVDAWEDVDSFDLDTPLASLVKRRVVLEREDETLTLSYGEWARLLVREAVVPLSEHITTSLVSVLDDERQAKALEAEFARLLAGDDEAGDDEAGDDGGTKEAEAPTFHAPCSIPGCDHEEGPPRPALDLAALRTLAREAKEKGEKATPAPWYNVGYKDTDGDGPHIETEDGGYRVAVCGISPPEHHANGVFIAAARSYVPVLASAVESLVDALEGEMAFVKAILNREPRDNLIARLTAQRDAAHAAGVDEERARRDLTIERLQGERDADRAAFETTREGLEGDKAKLAEDLDQAKRLAAARKDDLADMTRWRDEALNMVHEREAEKVVLTRERDEARGEVERITADHAAGLQRLAAAHTKADLDAIDATERAERAEAENERLRAEVATLKAEAAQRDAVGEQVMRHFMEGAPEEVEKTHTAVDASKGERS